MNLFDVYPLWDIEPVRAKGCKIWDNKGDEYLDLYGGHAVISIGHSNPEYIDGITEQLNKIGFYSNAVKNNLQKEFAERLGKVCGYLDYSLFLCNSGAEANENAMKLASFHTGRKKILAVKKAFHGRTSGAVEATDNPNIQAPFNCNGNIKFIELNNIAELQRELETKEYAAFIIEGIQGVAGIYIPNNEFIAAARELCTQTGTLLILDEIQSGYGRSGKFYAHQHVTYNGEPLKADIVSMAKGIANGFPMGAIIISPQIKPVYGMLGTTFGGNHLACAAALSTLKVLVKEKLTENAGIIGKYLKDELNKAAEAYIKENGKSPFKEIRGIGLMIGIEMEPEHQGLRNQLLFNENIFTGGAGKNVIRLLPPLCISKEEVDIFIAALKRCLKLG
ncbi:MAG: aminotransferase class III-fold pyridoxal phosphate-dependent enzyme [Bacteroidales bacterium]|nr:aminotransferase class III-fold pyridoxal phosphate-dependent enzyme [Bacteroidales bacterium]